MHRIDFERGEYPLIYRDCLALTDEEFTTLTAEEIEAMKDARYNAWIEFINTPPPIDEQEVGNG